MIDDKVHRIVYRHKIVPGRPVESEMIIDQNPDTTSKGQVGSSGLLVAREGDQLPDPTASQLGPLVARRIEVIDKPGGVCPNCGSTEKIKRYGIVQCNGCGYC